MSFIRRLVLASVLVFSGLSGYCQSQTPFQGKVLLKDGREFEGTILWHRQQDLIIVFNDAGLLSFRPNQASEVSLVDARFQTERRFVTGQALNLPGVRGLAELVTATEMVSIVSVNPGLYLSPGALSQVRTAIEASSAPKAYTMEDGPQFKRSLFRIMRSFCKHHGPAASTSKESLYLVDNSGSMKARKISLRFALAETLRNRKNRVLLRAIFAREGSLARSAFLKRYLANRKVQSSETAFVANR